MHINNVVHMYEKIHTYESQYEGSGYREERNAFFLIQNLAK